MLKLTSYLTPEIYTPVCYVIASTDHTSTKRIPVDDLKSGRCRISKIPRSREVSALQRHDHLVLPSVAIET